MPNSGNINGGTVYIGNTDDENTNDETANNGNSNPNTKEDDHIHRYAQVRTIKAASDTGFGEVEYACQVKGCSERMTKPYGNKEIYTWTHPDTKETKTATRYGYWDTKSARDILEGINEYRREKGLSDLSYQADYEPYMQQQVMQNYLSGMTSRWEWPALPGPVTPALQKAEIGSSIPMSIGCSPPAMMWRFAFLRMHQNKIKKGARKMSAVLEIKDFTKSYDGQKPAVDHVSLTVEEGEIFGFIGHNGAGKSTTIKSVVGILSTHNGEITIDGKTLWEAKKECQKKMAYIPDNPDLYEYMTGIDYINFIADIYEVSSEERTGRIEKMADAFEIKEQLGDLISSYSHGMKQKVALISAFVHQPKLLVLDEPFVGLDPKASAVLKKLMRELCDQGSAIFFSTHVLEVAEKLCDKVAMIDHGHIVVSGRIDELTKEKSLEEVFLEQLEIAREQVITNA